MQGGPKTGLGRWLDGRPRGLSGKPGIPQQIKNGREAGAKFLTGRQAEVALQMHQRKRKEKRKRREKEGRPDRAYTDE